MGFFADQDSVVEVDFPEAGVTVWIRRYMDEGIHEDVRNNMFKLNLRDNDDDASRAVRLQTGDLFTLQKMITKVVTPEKTYTAPIGMALLRKMTRAASAKLIAVVNENNPLEEAESETETEE